MSRMWPNRAFTLATIQIAESPSNQSNDQGQRFSHAYLPKWSSGFFNERQMEPLTYSCLFPSSSRDALYVLTWSLAIMLGRMSRIRTPITNESRLALREQRYYRVDHSKPNPIKFSIKDS
jgi:hypothetical protein